MHTTRLFVRLLVVCLFCTLLLPATQPGAAQTGPKPQPDPETTPETIPAGLSAEEWQSVQVQIAEFAALNPSYDPANGRQPTYTVAPINRVSDGYVPGGNQTWFGAAVDIDDEQMIVGAYNSDVGSFSEQGAVYLFHRNRNGPDQWGLIKKIVASDPADFTDFGYSMAISGDIVVVGAIGVNGRRGAAYVFYRNQGGLNNWGEVKKLTVSNGEADYFGWSVDIWDDTIVVGEYHDDLGGEAHIFQRNQGGADQWGLVQSIRGSLPGWGSFGWDVAIYNDVIAVGAPATPHDSKADAGAVYIFYHDGSSPNEWNQADVLDDGSYALPGDNFGTSVALEDGLLVVGSPGAQVSGSAESGMASVFTPMYFANEWLREKVIIPLVGTDYAQFGYNVSIDGQFIVVGAYNEGDQGEGAAYVYQRHRGGAKNWGLVQELNAIHRSYSDAFGMAVAVSNDRIVVGTPHYNGGYDPAQGWAHVFAIQAQDWYIHTTLQHELADTFHLVVDVDGDWLAVGRPHRTISGHADQGAVELYRRQLGAWQFVKQITLSDGAAGDQFGYAVALDGDLLAVGAPYWEGGNTDQGIVVLYKRDQGGIDNWGEWSNASMGGENGMHFGSSLAVRGDLLAIGVPDDDVGANANQGSVWVAHLLPTGPVWKNIASPDPAANHYFGSSLSLDNEILVIAKGVVGASEAVYVHYRNQGGADQWGMVKKLTSSGSECFGSSVSVSLELIAVGSPCFDNGANTDQGRVKIFSKNQDAVDGWGIIKTLLDSPGMANEQYGLMVALQYDRLLVASPFVNSGGDSYLSAYRRYHSGLNEWGRFDRIMTPRGGNYNWGLAIDHETAAYTDPEGNIQVLSFQANYWMLQGAAPPPAATTGTPGYAFSVDLQDDLLVVGAEDENSNQGAAYLFKRNRTAGEAWGLVKRLVASDGAGGDEFGSSVGLAGDWVAVGASQDDGTGTDEGSVYLFQRDQGGAGNWGQFKKIPMPAGSGYAYFGNQLELDGDTLAVSDLSPRGINIFYRDQGGTNNWGLLKKIATNGTTIALHQDTLVGGNYTELVGGNTNQGEAWVFYRHQSGADNWGLVTALTASDGASSDYFGSDVGVHGDVIVVGADGENSNRGAAYIFYRHRGGTNSWGELKKLTASDAEVDDYFGYAVEVYGDHILVGAPYNHIAAYDDQGAVYWFWRNYTGMDAWGQFSRLLLPHGAANDRFGMSMAIWEDQLAIGAPYDYTAYSPARGAAYIFRLMLLKELYLPLVTR